MSEGNRRQDDAGAHADTIVPPRAALADTVVPSHALAETAVPPRPAVVAETASPPAGTLPGVGQPNPGPTVASILDRRVVAQAQTLPATTAHDSTIDVPHAATLAGPYVEADLPAMQKIADNAYAIGDEIARGGMGKILSARDRRLRRDVVIKVTRHDGRIDPRFEREALITARLQHPSIVRVYEAGLLGDGRAFYAMERVRGTSLEHVIEKTPQVQDRLALLPHAIAVADAIAYAHSEGVLHRDLKPSNVLIGPFGETVVIDWGLAKDLRATTAAESLDALDAGSGSSNGSLTMAGSVMGTPSYMAPEQARGDASDERTDIFALGALLYTLLAGVPPYRGRTTEEVLELVAAGHRLSLSQREPTLPPELATIVERAMAHAAADRYQTAKELAEDLRAFAAGKLVASHQYSIWRLVRRFVRRHKITVGVAAFAVVVLVIVGALSIKGIVRARDAAAEEKRNAEVAREQAEANLRDLNRSTDLFYRNQAEQWRDVDPSHTAAWLERLSDRALAEPATYELAAAAARLGFAWELRGHRADIEIVALSPDRTRLVTASDDATLRVWNVADYSVQVLEGHVGPMEDVRFSPDGTLLASAGTDGNVFLWDVASRVGRKLRAHATTVRGVAFSPDGTQLASTSEDGTVHVWDVATGTGKQLIKRSHGFRPVVWSRDGTTVIAGGFDGAIGRFELGTGRHQLTPANGVEIRCFALSADGTKLAAGDENGDVTLWTGTTSKVLGSHTDVVRDLAFAPDGKTLVSAGGDEVVRVYDLATGTTTELRGNTDGVKDLDISSDGAFVATAGIDGVARVWPLRGGIPRELRGHNTAIKGIAFVTPRLVVSASEDDNARVWKLDATEETPPRGAALRAWLKTRTNVEVHTAPRSR